MNEARTRLGFALRDYEHQRREDDEGGASVREPRRPKPHAPAGAMALELELELEESYA